MHLIWLLLTFSLASLTPTTADVQYHNICVQWHDNVLHQFWMQKVCLCIVCNWCMCCVCIESIPVFVVCVKYCKLVLMDPSQGSLVVNASSSKAPLKSATWFKQQQRERKFQRTDVFLMSVWIHLKPGTQVFSDNIDARAVSPITVSIPSHPTEPIRNHF